MKSAKWPENWKDYFYCLDYSDEQIIKPGEE